uniref:TauD/TfdA family dioxygenase n=1 Tax=Herbidospora sakaeratensis TaxID=564415 RepID=UPI000782F5E2|nr:TauD/TfdA family dioxygenase [Herbidospora sakaeratensis]
MAGPCRLTLLDCEIDEIGALLSEVAARYSFVDDTGFLMEAERLAHGLPRRLRAFLAECRAAERPLFVIARWPVDDAALGLTPPDWRAGCADHESIHRHQLLLVLAASLLGDPFTLSSAQGGHLVNHIVPVAGAERQISAASSEELGWHTEEAGFRFRPDHLGFICLRNPQRVPMMIGLADHLVLDPAVREILRSPLFGMPQLGAAERIEYAPVLYGDVDRPYLSADSVYMVPAPGDRAAAEAWEVLGAAIDTALRPFVMEPGDLYFLDNHRAVHGRPAFLPRYDGADRWLLRVKIGRDLRASRPYRGGAGTRVIDFDRLG